MEGGEGVEGDVLLESIAANFQKGCHPEKGQKMGIFLEQKGQNKGAPVFLSYFHIFVFCFSFGLVLHSVLHSVLAFWCCFRRIRQKKGFG